MPNDVSPRNDDRFTLADYEDDQPVVVLPAGKEASMEEKRDYSPTTSTPTPTPMIPVITAQPTLAQRREAQEPVSGSTSSSRPKTPWNSTSFGSAQLRLHQVDERPTYPPSALTTNAGRSLSLSHLSSTSSESGWGVGPVVTSPTSSEVRPLPSIPRSFSSQRSLHSGPSSESAGWSSGPLRSPISEAPERRELSFDQQMLSPSSAAPRMDRRGSALSSVSGVSAASGAWTERVEKDRDIPVLPPPLTRGQSGTRVSRWYELFWPASWTCRCLLLTVVFETIINLAIEGNILWRFNSEIDIHNAAQMDFERKRRMPIFLIIFGLAHLWQLVLVFIAIRTRNNIQVNAVTIFNFALLAYAVIQIYELRQILGSDLADGLTDVDTNETLLTLPLNILTGVVIGVIAAGSIILAVLAYLLRKEFGWQRYRFLGADLQIRKYFFRFQVYECVCYFSAFFCAGFGIQFIWLVLQKTDVEYIITWIAFPLLILLLVLGRWAARYENVYAMGVFMVGLVAGCAYFIFKLVRIWQQQSTKYYRLTKSMTVFDVLSLVSLMTCFAFGAIVWRDFGKGLKEAVLNQKRASSLHSIAGIWKQRSKTEEEGRSQEMDKQRRISID